MRTVSETDKFRILSKESKGDEIFFLEKKGDSGWMPERSFGILCTDEDAILASIEHIKSNYPELFMDQILKLDPDDSQKYPENTNVIDRYAKIDGREVKFFEVHHNNKKIGEVWNRDDAVSEWYAAYVCPDEFKHHYEDFKKTENIKNEVLPRLDTAVQHLVEKHNLFTDFSKNNKVLEQKGFFKRLFKRK